MLIDSEDPYSGQVRRVGVDEVPGGGDGDLVDQFPAHAEGLGGCRDAHPVDGKALEDPAGHPTGQRGSIVGARQGGLEDLPAAGGVGAGEARYPDVQASGEPDDRQVDESTSDVVPLRPRHRAVRAGIGDCHRGSVDDGECAGVGSTGDRQSEFRSAADGVGDEVASRVHARVLVRSDEGVVTLILYRPGPLYVVPPRVLVDPARTSATHSQPRRAPMALRDTECVADGGAAAVCHNM